MLSPQLNTGCPSEENFSESVSRFISNQEEKDARVECIEDLTCILAYARFNPEQIKLTQKNLRLLTVLTQEIYIDRRSYDQKMLIEAVYLLLPILQEGLSKCSVKEKKANPGLIINWVVLDTCFSSLVRHPKKYRLDVTDGSLMKMVDAVHKMASDACPPRNNPTRDNLELWKTLGMVPL